MPIQNSFASRNSFARSIATSTISREYKEATLIVLFRGLKSILMKKRDEIPEDVDPKAFINQFVDDTAFLILTLKFSRRENQQANEMEYDHDAVTSLLQSNYDLETLMSLCDLSEEIGATLLNEGVENTLFGFENYMREFEGMKTGLKVLLWNEFWGSGATTTTKTNSKAANNTATSV